MRDRRTTALMEKWSREQQASFLRSLSIEQLLAPFVAANLGGMYTAPALIRDGDVLDAWKRAHLIQELEGARAAIPFMRAILDRDPDHAGAAQR